MLKSAVRPGKGGVALSVSVRVQNLASCRATPVEKQNIYNLGLEGLQVHTEIREDRACRPTDCFT